MLRVPLQRACFGLVLALSIVSCSDDSSDDGARADGGSWPDTTKDAGYDSGVRPDIDSAVDAGGVLIDAAVDANVVREAGAKALASCLERPGIPTPPTGSGLPCELVPPGLSL